MIWIILFQSKKYFSDSPVCISQRKGFGWLEIQKFFRNFLFQSMEWSLTIFIDGYWGRPDLFFWFFTVQRRSCFVKCIRTFYEKWYRDSGCLTRDYAVIRSGFGHWAFTVIWERRFMLYRLILVWALNFLFLIKKRKGIRILR